MRPRGGIWCIYDFTPCKAPLSIAASCEDVLFCWLSSSLRRHPRAVLWPDEAFWSGRITGHHAVPVPRGLCRPRLLQYRGKVGRWCRYSWTLARADLFPCFDCSVFYTSGRWKSSTQRHYFYFVEIMNVDIWRNISLSNKNVSMVTPGFGDC